MGLEIDKLNILDIECDVTIEQSIIVAYDKIVKVCGRIDVVVASAGKWCWLFV